MSNIKNIKPSSKSGYKQGYYKPVKPEKYVGPVPIIFRSSLEYKFCHYCDQNPYVLKWSSEPFEVRYFNLVDHKYHKYYPDFYIKMKQLDGSVIQYVIEVKPFRKTKKPIKPKKLTVKAVQNYRKELNTYTTNFCKLESLKKYAVQRGYEVMLITEKSGIL